MMSGWPVHPLHWVPVLWVLGTLDGVHGERVIVLGAGAAGIAAAVRLLESGMEDILILEGGPNLGGRMKSATFAGKTVDVGASWVQGANSSNWLARLVQEYGIRCNASDWESWLDFDDHGRTNKMPWGQQSKWALKWGQQSSNLVREPPVLDGDMSVQVAAGLLGWRANDKYADALMVAEFDYETAARPSRVSFKHTYPIGSYTDFGGDDCFINDQRGFPHVLRSMVAASRLAPKIRFNQTVRHIDHSGPNVTAVTQDGSYQADHVIVTFSIGVLRSDMVRFTPALPQWKTAAVNKYGMETYVKVFLEFPHQFWPDEEFYLYADAGRGHYPVWQNMNYWKQWGAGPPHVMVVTVMNDNARKIERQPQNVTVVETGRVLRSMFPGAAVPEPVHVLLHSWTSDPLFKGSYSFWPSGFTLKEKEQLCRPVGRIWFAGEACHKRYSPFVHGALLSGNDTAARVAQCVTRPESCDLGTEVRAAANFTSKAGWFAIQVLGAAGIALLATIVAARETFVCLGAVRGRGTSKRWLLQLACTWTSLLDSMQYSFLIPVSYDLAKAASGSAVLSGFFIGTSGIGYFAGVLVGRLLWQAMSYASIRRLIVLCPLLSGGIFLYFALCLASDLVHNSGLAVLVLGVQVGAGFS